MTSLAPEFASFLLDRIDVKVDEIRKATQGDTTRFVVDELQIFVDQLRTVIDTAIPEDNEPTPPRPQRRSRRTRPTPTVTLGGETT